MKKSKEAIQEYNRRYFQEHKEEIYARRGSQYPKYQEYYRNYMRDYMREYRRKKREAVDKTPAEEV